MTVRVTAPAGNTQDYTVRITRETASGNNNLSNLVVSAGTLNPNNVPFNPSITSYTVSVPNTTASTTVTASLQEPTTATMTLSVNNGTPSNLQHNVPSSSIALAVGDTKLDIVVRAQNGTLKTYTVTVTRNP